MNLRQLEVLLAACIVCSICTGAGEAAATEKLFGRAMPQGAFAREASFPEPGESPYMRLAQDDSRGTARAPKALRRAEDASERTLPLAPPSAEEENLVKIGRDEYTTPVLKSGILFGGQHGGSAGNPAAGPDVMTLSVAGTVGLILFGVTALLWHAAYQSSTWRKPR